MVDKKKRLKVPKCIYSNWYCWQRNTGDNRTYHVSEYGTPDSDECAACIAAHLNWGDKALRRPMKKEEVQAERKKYEEL